MHKKEKEISEIEAKNQKHVHHLDFQYSLQIHFVVHFIKS